MSSNIVLLTMQRLNHLSHVFLALGLLICLIASATGNHIRSTEDGRDVSDAELKLVYRVFEECEKKHFESCLAMKAVSFLDRAMKKSSIFLVDGLSLEKSKDIDSTEQRSLTEEDLERSLPQDEEERTGELRNLLLDRIGKFLQFYSLRIRVPEDNVADLKRSIEEGKNCILLVVFYGFRNEKCSFIVSYPFAILVNRDNQYY